MFTSLTGWALPEFLLLAEFGGATAPPMSYAYAPKLIKNGFKSSAVSRKQFLAHVCEVLMKSTKN